MAFLIFHTLRRWLSLVLVLVYIGGIRVLFLYISALARRQKIVFPGVYPYLMLHLILLWLYSETLSPLLTKNRALFLRELSLKGNTGLLVLTAYLGLLILATIELLKDNRIAIKSYVSKF
jgi:NADH:ubiquinone oxidoreductase subunit 6 (subunit J)